MRDGTRRTWFFCMEDWMRGVWCLFSGGIRDEWKSEMSLKCLTYGVLGFIPLDTDLWCSQSYAWNTVKG